MDRMKRWLQIGLLLVVAWIVLKIVFKIAGFVLHLLVIVGLIFIAYSVFTYLMGRRRRY